MQKNKINLEENKKSLFLLVFIIFFLLIVPCFFAISTKAILTPASPSGPTSGFNNTEYRYVMATTESGSSWKFDWGDGNYSDWIKAGQSCNNVSQIHSWERPGSYNVAIKYRSKYMKESPWSSPLIVVITIPTDLDDTKDTDDYKIYVNINGAIHYLIDTNDDNRIDSFYNTLTNITTNIEMQSDATCLISIDGDSRWDYIYNFADSSIKPFNYESKPASSFEFPWLTAAITIAIVILIVIFLLFKTGIFYVYEEEYEAEEK